MNRQEFMQALRNELSQLPAEEIDAAVEYFEECFDEATDGLDAERAAAEEKRLTEEFGNPKRIAAQIRAEYAARLLDGDKAVTVQDQGKTNKLSAVWWVIIGICSAPIAVPIAIVIFALIMVVIACIIAGIIGGGAAIVAGLFQMGAITGAAGIMIAGIGMMMLSVSLAAAYGAIVGIIAIGKTLTERSKRKKAEAERKEAETNEENE